MTTGAGSRFDLERAETDVLEQKGQLDGAQRRGAGDAAEAQARAGGQIQQKLGAKVEGRVRAGGAGPRAARERAMAARGDDHALALRLLRR